MHTRHTSQLLHWCI